jgi:multidrug efflux system membrane fusion protein
LAVVDPRPYLAALQQAQGQLARDEATLKNAHIDLTRYENSYKVHAIPEQQLATQQATVDSDEATVKLDRGNLAAAQVNVDYTRIVSPIAGRVGLRNIDPGNVVAANSTSALCVVTQIQPITVIFTIAEDEIDEVTAQMATGKPLENHRARPLEDPSARHRNLAHRRQPSEHQHGHGARPGHLPQRRQQTLPQPVREYPSPGQNADPGDARAPGRHPAQQRPGLRLRAAARQHGQADQYQHLATEGETSAVDGVKSGDQLVTDGFDKLQDGSKVRVRKPGDSAARAKSGQRRKSPKRHPSSAKSGG